MGVEHLLVREFGRGNVLQAPLVRAGRWIFGTGLRAVDKDGVVPFDIARPTHPLSPPPKPEREAQFIFEQLASWLKMGGSSLDNVLRVDQYYSDRRAVDHYHGVRKRMLRKLVAPSTSILISGLLNHDADIDLQLIASVEGSPLAEGVRPASVGSPGGSGYVPCLKAGDFIFVAGQLARDSSGQIALEAKVPDKQLWEGTQIKLETKYLIDERIKPALSASKSDLDCILKAQVYLGDENDLPSFLSVWKEAFSGKMPPTTIVPVSRPAFGTEDASIEINVIAAASSAGERIKDIDADVPLLCEGMVAGRQLDDLLFVAGIMGIDHNGLIPSARKEDTAPYFIDSAAEQGKTILQYADTIFRAAGTDLNNVVRAIHFHTDLGDFKSVHNEWEKLLGRRPLPFTAVRTHQSMFVPGASVAMDLWGWVP